MKKYLAALLLTAAFALFATGASAYIGTYTPGAGINGTVHDLGTAHNGMNYTAQPADPLQRICIFCHAPHNTYRLNTATGGQGPQATNPAFDYLPLWNHTLQSNINYTMYDNGTGAPTVGSQASQAIQNGMQPGSVSLLCLSCHDGSTAVNSYGNAYQLSQSTGGTIISTTYQIGADKYLGNHHPIGFSYYDVEATDTQIRDADSTFITPTTTISDHLYNGNMECATCHSVHNKGNAGEHLLWRSDQNSELCLTCHDKGTYTAPE